MEEQKPQVLQAIRNIVNTSKSECLEKMCEEKRNVSSNLRVRIQQQSEIVESSSEGKKKQEMLKLIDLQRQLCNVEQQSQRVQRLFDCQREQQRIEFTNKQYSQYYQRFIN